MDGLDGWMHYIHTFVEIVYLFVTDPYVHALYLPDVCIQIALFNLFEIITYSSHRAYKEREKDSNCLLI